MYGRNEALLYALSVFLVVQIIAETAVTGPLVARMERQSDRTPRP